MKEPVKGNKIFSDEKKKKEKLDFQTEHMKNKIKNVKKKKKMLNIRNIEPLVNIHETSEDNQGEPIIEGLNLNPIVTFTDDEWTGNDNIYEGGNADGKNTKSFAEIIENTYRKINERYDKLALDITTLFSGKKYSQNSKNIDDDSKHIKKYMNWLLAIIIASIAVYNWVFLMFFTYDNCLRVKVLQTPRKLISNWASINPFFKILDMFANIPLFFPEYLQQILIVWIPNFIKSKIDDPSPSCSSSDPVHKDGLSKIVVILIFMFMLVMFSLIAIDSGELIKNTLVNIANFEFEGILTIFIYFVTFILFIITFMETNPLASILPFGGLVSFFKYASPIFWFEKIIHLIYLIFVGVPLATCLCLLYILIYTFFAIPIYKGSYSISEIKELIDEYLDLFKPTERKDTPCNPLTFFEKIINHMVKMFNYIYENCIKIGFLIVMFYMLIDSGINIKDNMVKFMTMGLSIFVMIIVAIVSILLIIKQDDTEEPLDNNETPITTPIENPITTPIETPITKSIETINENIKLEPDIRQNITNIAEKLDLNDNKKLQDGLTKGVNMISNMMKK